MKITIAIPTRDRAEFLRASLATCVGLDDADLEILVCDNASTDATPDICAAFHDPRIRLLRQPERVSQRLNFERAAREARGDYVLMIGDDDAVLASSWPKMRRILEHERPDALSLPSVFYRWPTPHDPSAGRLKLKRAGLFGALRAIETADYRRMIETGDLPRVDIGPKLYHGFASRQVLNRLVERTGWVFGSGQVDLYFAAAALSVMTRYLHLDHPATILAMGPRSGGLSVQGQFGAAAASNTSAAQVAAESTLDTVSEPIAGRMPVLTMYLLTGLEQARRMAFNGALELDYARYLDRILPDLDKVPDAARASGLAQLSALMHEINRPDLVARLAQAAARASPFPAIPKPPRAALIESYLTPSKIALDLRNHAGGNVLAAAQACDYLLASAGTTLPDRTLGWTTALRRAAGVLARRLVGAGPHWGEPILTPPASRRPPANR